MVATRGWPKAAALLIGLALSVPALCGCEVTDDVGLRAPDAGPSARSAAPGPSLPAYDPALVAREAGHTAEVQRLLGVPPAGALMWGVGGVGSRQTAPATPTGAYTVAAACAGAPAVLLTVSQAARRNGTRLQLNIECGRVVEASVALGPGQTTVQFTPGSTGPGAAAGFRLERRTPS